jgi:hypothetical protein
MKNDNVTISDNTKEFWRWRDIISFYEEFILSVLCFEYVYYLLLCTLQDNTYTNCIHFTSLKVDHPYETILKLSKELQSM